MNPLEKVRARIAELLTERSALVKRQTEITDAVRADKRSELNATETAEYEELRTKKRGLDSEHDQLVARETELVEEEKRDQAAAAAHKRAGAPEERARVSEPDMYERGGKNSYFRDLALSGIKNDYEARNRLQRHTEHELEKRALAGNVDGSGGEMVPPSWLNDEFIRLARPGRITADRVRKLPLPAGTDSINLPKITGSTVVAEQVTQNTTVAENDMTTGSVESKVATLAGTQTVALQLVEQSPINIDEVVLGDLAESYAIAANAYILNANAAGKRGLLNVPGLNAVTWTDATPTAIEFYAKLADAIQRIWTTRYLPPDTITMHPRRWSWLLAQPDGQGRPLVVPTAQGPNNALGTTNNDLQAEVVGTIQGVPVVADPAIPTNGGAGTNEDSIVVYRSTDPIFFESAFRAEAFRETLAKQLSVVFRLYNYVAAATERYPKGISVISGTGLVAPAF